MAMIGSYDWCTRWLVALTGVHVGRLPTESPDPGRACTSLNHLSNRNKILDGVVRIWFGLWKSLKIIIGSGIEWFPWAHGHPLLYEAKQTTEAGTVVTVGNCCSSTVFHPLPKFPLHKIPRREIWRYLSKDALQQVEGADEMQVRETILLLLSMEWLGILPR